MNKKLMFELRLEEMYKKFIESEDGADTISFEEFKEKAECVDHLLGAATRITMVVASELAQRIREKRPDISEDDMQHDLSVFFDNSVNAYNALTLNQTLVEIDKSILLIYKELKESNKSFHSIAESLAALVLLKDNK